MKAYAELPQLRERELEVGDSYAGIDSARDLN